MEWISVKDRLPETDKMVLVVCNSAYCEKPYSTVGNYTCWTSKKWLTKSGAIDTSVTHWMPLPQPPIN